MSGSRKKIIYLITKANWGGAQKYVFDLATSLPQDKFDVLVVHGQGNILSKKLQEEKIKTIFVPEMGRDINVLGEIISFFKIFKIIFDYNPDIVHVNSSKAGGIGAFVARLTFTQKIIFTVHGWAFNEPQFDNILTKFFSWLTVFLSTDTIVISKQNFEQGLRYPFVKNRFALIYNGVKDTNFRERTSARKFIADLTKADSKKIWVVTISELHKNKGLSYLIEAVSKLEKKPIVFIIGEGEERNNLGNLISKHNLEDNIFLMGFIDEASTYLKAFDIFILTSVKEGHPYALLEAGLAKLPSIGSDIPGVKDILENENGILTIPKDPNDIAEKLDGLIKDKGKKAQLGQNLHSKVFGEFSFKEMLEKTISLY